MKKYIALILSLALLTGCSAPVVKTGLGIHSYRSYATDADGSSDAFAQADTTSCAVTVDEEGIILSISFDATQTKFTFDSEGKSTTDMTDEVKSKKQLGDDYGMRKASPIGKELDEQLEAFEAWAIGQNIDDVLGMPTIEKSADYPAVPDVPELEQSCTIDVSDYLKALSLAKDNLK